MQLRLGSNVATIVVKTTAAMEALHLHGLHVVVTTMVATGKALDTVDLLAVEQLLGNDSRTILPLLPRQADNTAMVDTQVDTGTRMADMVDSRLWVLLQVLVVALVDSALRLVWVLCFRIMDRMAPQGALHLHLPRMIFLHR